MLEFSEIVLFSSAIFGLAGFLLSFISQLSDMNEFVSDISTGLHRELARAVSTNNMSTLAQSDGDVKALHPAEFRKFKVQKVTNVSYNTKMIRFEIPQGKTLGLSMGRHVSVRADIGGKPVLRAYTPTSRPDTKDYFDLVVKTYEMGKLSPYLYGLKAGDMVEVRGPVGRFQYTKNLYKKMGFVAGGTGLTPCLQVIRCLLEGPESNGDTTSMVLLFQNRTEADVLLRDELDKLAASSNGRLQVIYFLSNPTTTAWGSKSNERRGYINQEAMNSIRPAVAQFVGLCGPGTLRSLTCVFIYQCCYMPSFSHTYLIVHAITLPINPNLLKQIHSLLFSLSSLTYLLMLLCYLTSYQCTLPQVVSWIV